MSEQRINELLEEAASLADGDWGDTDRSHAIRALKDWGELSEVEIDIAQLKNPDGTPYEPPIIQDAVVTIDYSGQPLRSNTSSLMGTRALAQSFLDRADEDWTFTDPEDIKRLARAVLGK